MTVAGGTSAATPFWAASTALVAEYAGRHGDGQLGFVDPTLYAIAARPQLAPALHDITIGGNRYYPAAPGWDFATGLGSPEVTTLPATWSRTQAVADAAPPTKRSRHGTRSRKRSGELGCG